jgi:hypothetical protein
MTLSGRHYHQWNRHFQEIIQATVQGPSIERPTSDRIREPYIQLSIINVLAGHKKRTAATCVSQEIGIIRRSCLAKASRVKARDIEIGNPASRKPFAV